MEINIWKYKMRVEILVAIIVVFWVMFGHLLCSCCKVSLFEGLKKRKQNKKAKKVYKKDKSIMNNEAQNRMKVMEEREEREEKRMELMAERENIEKELMDEQDKYSNAQTKLAQLQSELDQISN